MSLNELLRDLVNGCGALGALVMTSDGFPLDEFRRDSLFDPEGCSRQFSGILRETLRLTPCPGNGGVKELSLLTEEFRFVIRIMADDVALLLVLPSDGEYGKARYLLARDLRKFSEGVNSEE